MAITQEMVERELIRESLKLPRLAFVLAVIFSSDQTL